MSLTTNSPHCLHVGFADESTLVLRVTRFFARLAFRQLTRSYGRPEIALTGQLAAPKPLVFGSRTKHDRGRESMLSLGTVQADLVLMAPGWWLLSKGGIKPVTMVLTSRG